MVSASEEIVARLARLDSCAVSDALDRLGLAGVVLGIHPVGPPRRISGRAVTVCLERATPEVQARLASSGAGPRHLGTAAVDASGPGDIIVVANGGGETVSGWGGLLSLGAKRRGVEGVIVDGGCRDADEAWEMEFPVYARSTVPHTARGRVVETAWNETVSIGGTEVSPGDFVIADRSGIVFLAADRAEEILRHAEEIMLREAAMAEAVRSGRTMTEVMGATYEHLLQQKSPP